MPRDRQSLADILDSARLAIRYVHGMSKEGFLADTQCQDWVLRRLEIIGEAARPPRTDIVRTARLTKGLDRGML